MQGEIDVGHALEGEHLPVREPILDQTDVWRRADHLDQLASHDFGPLRKARLDQELAFGIPPERALPSLDVSQRVLPRRTDPEIHDREAEEGVLGDAKPCPRQRHACKRNDVMGPDLERQPQPLSDRGGAEHGGRPHLMQQPAQEQPLRRAIGHLPDDQADAPRRGQELRVEQGKNEPVVVGLGKHHEDFGPG